MTRTTRRVVVGVGVVTLGLVASHLLGSRPEATEADAPVAVCPGTPTCARVRVEIAAPPADVRAAARRALTGTGGLTGSTEAVTDTPTGALATVRIGPFVDEVAVEVDNAPTGAVLWVRSASRVGGTDLGVNRWRTHRLVDAVAGWLPDGAVRR
ncbi:DUF1499 domain-containing protein [Rubrivirga sp. IMCC45206]|uniref:DUF1499 domain-containing protein n=1 Tax=Rubrivirga sp. IMCC45206 TaxID=3391614 RepID=UPI00398FD25D